ncbi:hypothetical protein F4779DRAFT_631950 [Xylariaceae sp. FL0662B]|nr:hypothetical protein F4779DRAFT_631950 [Xylariaceae sp. FL0662B]
MKKMLENGIEDVLGNLVIPFRDLPFRSSTSTPCSPLLINVWRGLGLLFIYGSLCCKHTQHETTSRASGGVPKIFTGYRVAQKADRSGGEDQRKRERKRVGGNTETRTFIRQTSKMFISPAQPQFVWDGFPPSVNVVALESQSRINCEKDLWQQFIYRQLQINDFIRRTGRVCNASMSQRLEQPVMDDQHWYHKQMADSGDEAYMTDDIYSDCFLGIRHNTPNIRDQTTAVNVSGVSAGREFGPSHRQSNKEPSGNDQMFVSNYPTTNTYTQSLGGSFDPRHYSWQTYNTTGFNQGAGFPNFHDGLPGNGLNSSLPVFAEPLECNQVSPSTVCSSMSSSAISSATSEAIPSTSINPITTHSNTTGNLRTANPLSATENVENGWGTNCPSTISPKMLRIQPSPTLTSSSESAHTNMLPSGDSDLGSSKFEPRHARNPVPSKHSSHKPRKELPNKPIKPRPTPLASLSSTPSKAKSPDHSHLPAANHNLSGHADAGQLEANTRDNPPRDAEGSGGRKNGTKVAAAGRAAKDEYLVKSKLAGMTYREIRRHGNFTEAESTLRGRFRTLTKSKEERVRKPEWQDNDVRLLKKAVHKLAKVEGASIIKAPWKQVADYIFSRGGSYHFGNSTCRKKWDELVEQGQAGLNETGLV